MSIWKQMVPCGAREHVHVHTHPSVPALGCSQLGQHLLLHPPAVAHHQFENHQRVGGGRRAALLLVLAPDSLRVSLQGQEGVADVVSAVALLDEQLFTLGLGRGGESGESRTYNIFL